MKKIITITILAVAWAYAGYCQAPSIIAADGTYLGSLSANTMDPNSVYNEWGTYGNKWSQNSIWNEWGTYGSPYSAKSPWNPWAASRVEDGISF